MKLSEKCMSCLRELEGDHMNLNHIPAGDPRLKKLQKMVNDELKKTNPYRSKKKRTIIIRKPVKGFYSAETIDWAQIRYVRGKRAISQTDMAKLIGVSTSHYQRLERRLHGARKDLLYKICKVLEIEIVEAENAINPKIYKEVESEMKKKRMSLGLSQFKAANKAGIAQGTYSRIENGLISEESDLYQRADQALDEAKDVTMNAR